MIFFHGDTTQIKTAQWHVMELRSERTAEEILKRVLIALKDTFREDPVEVFIPEHRTRECSFTLLTESYVFVRSDDPTKIGKLRRVTGVQGMVSKDDSTRVNSFLTVDDDYVQSLMVKVMDAYYARGAAIKEGAWVKILDGQDRDLYGHVICIVDGRAVVQVDLNTKLWFVDTSIYNLMDCSNIEPRFRVYYYGPAVEKMIEDDPDAAAELLKDDLHYDEAAVRAWLYGEDSNTPPGPTPEDAAKTSREHTPSRFVRSLIRSGERSVRKLLTQTVDAIREGHLRCPQTTTILWHIIRTELLHHAFPGEELGTYTDLVKKHGAAYNLYPADVANAFPELAAKDQEPVVVPKPVEPLVSRATTTSYVREHLKKGGRDLMVVVRQLRLAIKRGEIRAPKHLDSFIQAIRTQVFRHFRLIYPALTYAEIVAKEGAGLTISIPLVQAELADLEAIILKVRAKQIARIETRKIRVPLGPDFETSSAPIAPKPNRQRVALPSTF